jgi:hypothetical protein
LSYGKEHEVEANKMIEKIQAVLEAGGQSGTPYQIARMLNVAPSTVLRWKASEARPRGKQEQSLNLLYRTVVEAENGNEIAATLLKRFAVPIAGVAYLAFGLPGVLMAAGLGWLVGTMKDEEK